MPRPKKRVKLSPEGEESGSHVSASQRNGHHAEDEHGREAKQRKTHEPKGHVAKRSLQADDSDDDSSSSEDEDDQGELVTEALDTEIMATLKALKSKDPSIYDKTKQFYRPIEDGDVAAKMKAKPDKPVYLSDYHRQNYLAGKVDGDDNDDEDVPIQTYDQEQEALRRSVVKAMYGDSQDQDDSAESDNDDLLVKKKKAVSKSSHDTKVNPVLDVENADRDPETFLSNFMTARAWVPEEGSRFANLDEDDSEEERLAETFEEAYNLRFEDPATANEKMVTYARDAGKYSARRDDATIRKQKRDKQKDAKAEIKAEQEREKARRRNAKIDGIEHKIEQIREAAGIGADETVNLDEWRAVLDDDFDDDKWEEVMAKKYGDEYYAMKGDKGANDSDEGDLQQSDKTHEKPTWAKDIDVADIASLDDDSSSDDDEVAGAAKGPKLEKVTQSVKPQDKRRVARQQRAAIEALVDNGLVGQDENPERDGPLAKPGFRYRETSPGAFGLSARDILFANDKQLNEFASMKKHHTFRDEERKRKDRKKLNSRAQRTWRKEVFGTEEGYKGEFADFVREHETGNEILAARKEKSSAELKAKDKKRKAEDAVAGPGDKKKRRRKKKTSADA